YRLRRHGQDGVAYLDVADSGDGGSVSWSAAAPPADTRVGGTCRFELDNDGDDEAIFIVEQLAWADDVLRPAELLSLQAFRDLFSEEFIAAGIHLAVGEQTILFTDIVGSTRLYLERGDPEAFAAVRQHFTRVFRTVVAHEGAVVKTIGDAAMATFNDASRAVSAALALHQAFPPGETIRLRISIHTGLCIAVNLNSNIDYFGNTVNLAAKLQGIAGAGDVALSEATRRAAGVEELLQAKGAELERVELDLPIVSYRWATTGGA
ncbi:MAG: adenylate/guanylate cyclase domain-containing protein, partial [Polyangiaceae bacterium]